MTVCSFVACVMIATSLWSISGEMIYVEYRVHEEQPPHTIIGDVAADTRRLSAVVNSDDELADLRYHLVDVIWNQPLSENDEKQSYFTLHTDSGLLTTSRAVLFVAALCYRAGHYVFAL